MAKTDKSVWLQHGYSLFAENGPSGLKVEILARLVGKSKSSFYHYFSDLESFIALMHKKHIARALEMVAVIEQAQTDHPDYVSVALSFKEDILFHRQLRFHRHIAEHLNCYTEAQSIIEPIVVSILAANHGLSDHKSVVRSYFQFALENFLFRATAPTIDAEWINAFMVEVTNLMKAIRQLPEPR